VSSFRVSIRVNVKPDRASAFVDFLGPLAKQTGLRFRNDAPGLLEGERIQLEQLGSLLIRLGELPTDLGATSDIVDSGLIDDVWVHLSREPK
jgi:hypothetical protein